MPVSIVLNDIKPTGWEVDVSSGSVIYRYNVLDDAGNLVRKGVQEFRQGTPDVDDDWLPIPQEQYDALVLLTQDARTTIANKEIGGLP